MMRVAAYRYKLAAARLNRAMRHKFNKLIIATHKGDQHTLHINHYVTRIKKPYFYNTLWLTI